MWFGSAAVEFQNHYHHKKMNDTTLPITKKKSNTRQRSNGNGGRVKKGFGLHDWMTLLRHALLI